ncbi:MAG: RagB/SusD family nutrient uptake outer membrane protein [Bacteroidales bacterium]
MKNIFIYTILCSLTAAYSCSGFLDSEPITSITEENFYRTKADAAQALIGCYDGIQRLYSATGIPLPILSEVCSDDGFGGTGFTDGYGYQVVDEFDQSRSSGDLNLLNGNWEFYYDAIYRINMLLSKMEQINWEDDSEYRNSVETQARFLRAYCYFDMVRLWERVPLLTEPTSGNIPQSGADAIYAQIAEDLKYAVDNGSSVKSLGYANKYAAAGLLGRVFLFYTGYYAKTSLPLTDGSSISKDYVLSGLEDIVSKGGYSLVSEFKNLWPAAAATYDAKTNVLDQSKYAGVDNSELIFSIKYNITSNYDGDTDGNHWLVMFGVRNNGYNPPYGQGWGACTVQPSLYEAFNPNDNRRDASIINLSTEYTDFDVSGQREHTGYMNKKYTTMSGPDENGKIGDLAENEGAINFQIGQYQDYIILRYADILLMAAELGSSNAQSYFDQVRARAGLSSRTVSKENIMNERRFEFAFEGLRYFDLLRQGVDVAAKTLAVKTTVVNGGSTESKTITADNITKKRGLQQIPKNVIDRSGGTITQNAGW